MSETEQSPVTQSEEHPPALWRWIAIGLLAFLVAMPAGILSAYWMLKCFFDNLKAGMKF
jgi:hypothetical protein